jgi:hypothetical protein
MPAFRIRHLLLVIALAILSPLSAVHAQSESLSTLGIGDTIRVWAVAPRLNKVTGTFSSFRFDTLTLGQLPGAGTVQPIAQVPYLSLRRVDVRRGKHRSTGRIIAGTLIGAGAGLLLGAAVGPAIECGARDCQGDLDGIVGFVAGAGLGTIIGGVTGGFIGARKQPNWRPVGLAR